MAGLNQNIADYYDEFAGTCDNTLGDHLHHGFYDLGAAPSADGDAIRAAQARVVEEALCFARVTEDPLKWPKNIVDVGCGLGGSSTQLAKKFGAKCIGITMSPVEVERAQALAAAEGLADKVSFQVADAMEQPFPDGQFDLVWSMDSGEHMPDKRKFVSELARVAAPGGTIIIVSCCHRDLLPSENSLQPDEMSLLNKICDASHLPCYCSASDYVKFAESLSLQDIKSADWTENVAPFWPSVFGFILTMEGVTTLLNSGWNATKGALLIPVLINEGYKKNIVKYSIITCRKAGTSDQ